MSSCIQKYKFYQTNETIRKFCIDTFVTCYLTDEEQLEIFKKSVEENGWPKQDQGKPEKHTLSHRLYYWAKRLLTKIDPNIVEERYPGFLKFAEKHHTTKRIRRTCDITWSMAFIDWCNKTGDYPRPKYIFGKNKIPKADTMNQVMVSAFNPGTTSTIKLSEEDAKIIRKTAESYGYEYVPGGLQAALVKKKKPLKKEPEFEEYVLWVKTKKRLPKKTSSNKKEQFFAKYIENNKENEVLVQLNTIVSYCKVSKKAKELLENY